MKSLCSSCRTMLMLRMAELAYLAILVFAKVGSMSLIVRNVK